MLSSRWAFTIVVQAGVLPADCNASVPQRHLTAEERLISTLFRGYDTDSRGVINVSSTVTVEIQFMLMRIQRLVNICILIVFISAMLRQLQSYVTNAVMTATNTLIIIIIFIFTHRQLRLQAYIEITEKCS